MDPSSGVYLTLRALFTLADIFTDFLETVNLFSKRDESFCWGTLVVVFPLWAISVTMVIGIFSCKHDNNIKTKDGFKYCFRKHISIMEGLFESAPELVTINFTEADFD